MLEDARTCAGDVLERSYCALDVETFDVHVINMRRQINRLDDCNRRTGRMPRVLTSFVTSTARLDGTTAVETVTENTGTDNTTEQSSPNAFGSNAAETSLVPSLGIVIAIIAALFACLMP